MNFQFIKTSIINIKAPNIKSVGTENIKQNIEQYIVGKDDISSYYI